eukprot:TRINITY_DN19632_c0_g1_i1.p1 TRINITY_DN19632_c0_g1~~TRINITY_DN19632_c0_g1_i1.p1  ORF type:complete len:565 (-),score=51.62 TRINITY_DN19632_c0_g1_i1:102-1796(-)
MERSGDERCPLDSSDAMSTKRLEAMIEQLYSDFKAESERAELRHEQLLRHGQRAGKASSAPPRPTMSPLAQSTAVSISKKNGEDPVQATGAPDSTGVTAVSGVTGKKDSGIARMTSGENNQTAAWLRSCMNDEEPAVINRNRKCGIFDRDRIAVFVKSKPFEFTMAAVISCNAALMAVQLQLGGQAIGFDLNYDKYDLMVMEHRGFITNVFERIDWIFGVAFVVECLFKLFVYRWSYFRQVMHYVDMSCVLTFFVERFAFIALPIDEGSIRLFRLTRMFRLVKLIGTFEQLDILHTMITAIRGMHLVLFWAMVLLGMILVTLALFMTQVLHAVYFIPEHIRNLNEHDREEAFEVFELFGTFVRSLYSMFELSLGNFAPVGRVLADNCSEWFFVACILHKITVGFAVVGVINAIVLQETFKAASTDDALMVRQRKRQEAGLRKKLKAFFNALDVGHNEVMTLDSLLQLTHYPDVMFWLKAQGVSTGDLYSLFCLCDEDGDGIVTRSQFIETVCSIREPALAFHLRDLQRSIRALSLNGCDAPVESTHQASSDGPEPTRRSRKKKL